jgi:lipoprotein-anchoring transpeptidase ErfK/SrfK
MVAIGAAVLVLAGGAAVFALSSGASEQQAVVRAKRLIEPTTTTTKPKFQAAITLTSNVDELKAYQEPDESSPVVSTFSKITDYKQPRTLLAVNTQEGWYQALLPMRPATGAYKDGEPMGWVKAADVIPGQTDYEIHLSVSQHKLQLLQQGQPVAGLDNVIVATGKAQTPTPIGTFYITDPVDLQSRPNGAYGAYALGLSAFSEVLKSFNGGPGQIAIHGNGQMDTIGHDVSNGCIRVLNDQILQIAKAVPLGTPVIIDA